MMKQASSPQMEGFHLPAEFEPQKAGYAIWPQRPDNWRNGGKPAQKAFVQLMSLLIQFQPMTVLVNESQYQHAKSALPSSIRVIEMSSDDAFTKDTGPFYLVNQIGEIRVADFQFNAWGGLLDGLYFPWNRDNEIAEKLAALDGYECYMQDFVLEGCAIVVDGEGTLITTEEVVLSEGRNNGVSREEAEAVLKRALNVKKVIWLAEGFYLDEAGGDIDNMVSFIRPGELALSWTDDEADPQYTASHQALALLEKAKDAKGHHFVIHKVQLPKPQFLSAEEARGVDPINGMLPRNEGQRLTATYVNYVTTNEAIIIPQFDDDQDDVAKQQFQMLYPDRQIIGFPVREFLTGGGGLHTLIANVPAEQYEGGHQ